ncbi:MAG: hypothetical protein KGQ60_02190 [Planctomycetes bacterium]|nr:hypothetical protein [Planctomycetota bacterium]
MTVEDLSTPAPAAIRKRICHTHCEGGSAEIPQRKEANADIQDEVVAIT